MVEKITRFLRHDLWNMQLERISASRAVALKLLRIVVLAVRGFDEDKCALRASALTFYTLLSIVPVLAMAFGVAKGFGFENMLERQLLERLQGQEEVVRYVIGFARAMLENTRGGMVAGIGIALLFWTVVKLLGNIELSFNTIWGVQKQRSLGRKFSDYLSAMLLCPVLLIMASSVTVLISSQVREIIARLPLLELAGPLIFTLLSLLPYCVMWVLFSFLYIFMPNTRVRFVAGIVGGVAAGSLYQVLQMAYISFQIGVAKYNAIYGGFAALPLFLIWLNLSWLIVLLGAEIAFAFQHADTYEFEPECRALSPGYRRLLTLYVMHLLVKRFAQGGPPPGVDDISETLRMPARLVRQIVSQLTGCGMAAEVSASGRLDVCYQPARDIGAITIAAVIDALDGSGSRSLPVHITAELEALESHLRSFSALIGNAAENSLLAQV